MQQELIAQLASHLSPKRLRHTLGVSETAEWLARRYGADEKKAGLAGLLHDCARDMPNSLLLHKAQANGIVLNDVELRTPVLLHAPVGALVAQEEYGLSDPEVLDAIRRHTTGGPVMSILDNIVFLADYIEPGRDFPGVDRLRDLARSDLERALVAAYDQTLGYLIAENSLIHPATVEGRNALMMAAK